MWLQQMDPALPGCGGASLERAQGVTRLGVQAIPGDGQGTSLTLYQGGSPEEAVSEVSLGWTGSYLISRCWGKAQPPPIG